MEHCLLFAAALSAVVDLVMMSFTVVLVLGLGELFIGSWFSPSILDSSSASSFIPSVVAVPVLYIPDGGIGRISVTTCGPCLSDGDVSSHVPLVLDLLLDLNLELDLELEVAAVSAL